MISSTIEGGVEAPEVTDIVFILEKSNCLT